LQYDETVDVVVAGAGVAGLMAGIFAAAEGASVLLVEKQPLSGGSSYISGGFFAFAGTAEQLAIGVTDTPQRLADDLLAVGGGLNEPGLIQLYTENQKEAYDLFKEMRVHFEPPVLSSGQSVPRSHQTYMPYLIKTLERELQASGTARIEWEKRISNLIQDHSGRIVGAEITDRDGRMRTIGARHGVVLACGGFSRNADLIARYAPDQRKAIRVGGMGNVGDGLILAEKAGAVLRDMDQVKGTFGCHPDFSGDEHLILLANYAGAIMVNTEGRRFVNESLSYKLLGNACLAQPQSLAFEVFDERIMAKSQPRTEMFDFRDVADRGYITSANTIEDLAAAIGVPAAALVNEIAAYNAVVSGKAADPFGRATLSRDYGALTPIDMPPFYAFKATSGVVATYCGVAVDTSLHAVRKDGSPIEGLYVIGEMMGGFHGQAYMTGSSLGKAAVFGIQAGRNAGGTALR